MKNIAKPKIDHPGKLIVAGILALVAAYIFGSLAIDRGNLLYYGLTFFALFIGVKHLWHGIKGESRGTSKR